MIFILLFSCSRPDYSTQIKTIDTLATEITGMKEPLYHINSDSITAMIDSVEKHVQYIQVNYKGPMEKKMAMDLAAYSTIKNLIHDAQQQSRVVIDEADRTITRLNDLKTSLSGEFTHDAQGNKWTIAYANQRCDAERKSAEQIIQMMRLLDERNDTIYARFHRYYPRIQFWTDSIPQTFSAEIRKK